MRSALVALTLLGLLLGGGVAHAAEAPCTVWVVAASAGAGGVDARLVRLKPFLEKPMFAEFHKFTLLEEKSMNLAENAVLQFKLPSGRIGELTYLGVTLGKNGNRRVKLRLKLDDTADLHMDTVLNLRDDGIFLHPGERNKDGALIIGLSCAAPKA